MMLTDILQDTHALEDEMRDYERKYGVTSETFYKSYQAGTEPSDDAWVRDWTAWASAYKVWLRRRDSSTQPSLSDHGDQTRSIS